MVKGWHTHTTQRRALVCVYVGFSDWSVYTAPAQHKDLLLTTEVAFLTKSEKNNKKGKKKMNLGLSPSFSYSPLFSPCRNYIWKVEKDGKQKKKWRMDFFIRIPLFTTPSWGFLFYGFRSGHVQSIKSLYTHTRWGGVSLYSLPDWVDLLSFIFFLRILKRKGNKQR